ncbi:hypothetical protein NDU88_005410 [Pleurodeles waltl]|uniref:Uncharacterized protein n=1 Tax=Pleurodeles waltl TaxID=8319 RepID=A0AAV7LPG4_PLEWA|nr:hypothetical protein NDU88_005410 [Pleurodeles waltl]
MVICGPAECSINPSLKAWAEKVRHTTQWRTLKRGDSELGVPGQVLEGQLEQHTQDQVNQDQEGGMEKDKVVLDEHSMGQEKWEDQDQRIRDKED